MYIFSIITANMLAWFLALYIHTHKANIVTAWKQAFNRETDLGFIVLGVIILMLGAFNFIPFVPHITYGIIFCFIKYDLINKIITAAKQTVDNLENIGHGE